MRIQSQKFLFQTVCCLTSLTIFALILVISSENFSKGKTILLSKESHEQQCLVTHWNSCSDKMLVLHTQGMFGYKK